MHFSLHSLLITSLSTLLTTTAATIPSSISCNAAKRIEITNLAVTNINLPTAAQSLAAYTIFPFTNDVNIFVNLNQAGPVQATYNRGTTLIFLAGLYQIISEVRNTYVYNIDDTTTFFHTQIQLGVAHATLPLPVNVDFDVVVTFVLKTCQMKLIVANATLPAA